MFGKTLRKAISLILSFVFLFSQTGFAQIAAMELNVAGHLSRFSGPTDKFRPIHLRYFSFDQLNNQVKVFLDKGDSKELNNSKLKADTDTLFSYFLIGITLPNEAFWVNLRPDGESNIIDNQLARTDIGKILLEADVQLKKDTAAFTSPNTPEGKLYWDKLYKKASEIYGSENITIPTLTRPWIVPGEIIIRETAGEASSPEQAPKGSAEGPSAYIYKATLKVCLEQDHLKNSTLYNFKDERAKALNEYSSELIRTLIIPKLTKEVNNSKRYSPLRQVYYSLILARWFKERFNSKSNPYANLINRSNLTNLTSKSPWSKTTYFNQYQKSFKDGEYNLKTPVSGMMGQSIRSYFSGGVDITNPSVGSSPMAGSFMGGNNRTAALLNGKPGFIVGANGVEGIEASSPIAVDKQWLTPEQATEELNKLSTISSIKGLEDYYHVVKSNSFNYERIFRDLDPELFKMAYILSQTKPHDELNELTKYGITIEELDILRAESEFILQFVNEQKGVDNLEQLKMIKGVFVKYPEISKLLVQYLETKFNPEEDTVSRGKAAQKIRLEISRKLARKMSIKEHRILHLALGMIMATTKTDYYLEGRTALTFRLDPRALVAFDHNGVLGHAPPFAIIWVHVPYGGFGAHSRYANIARGGLRALNPQRVHLLNKALSECVALSSVQHLKHIDIPEGGSKGAFVSRQGLNPVAVAIGYADGLINTMISNEKIVVASGGMAIDPLELGPDEGTAEIGSLITVRAWMRKLKHWSLLMTGNIAELFGTPHMQNDLLEPARDGNRVTSQGVMQHAFLLVSLLREKGKIKSNDGEPIKFSFTGGLDGDVGSGNIENAINHYGDNAIISAISDGTAAVFDPKGLDHKALLDMYENRTPGKDFPVDKLNRGGFVVEAKYGSSDDCYVELWPETLKHMNTRAFDPKVFEKLKAGKKFRVQAGLSEDQPLVTVLETDRNNHPIRVRVHSAYLRDVLFFVAKSDMLITGGGVRDSINDQNWELFFDWDDNPAAPGMCHGANVFSSEQASINLEKRGVSIETDFMSNSVGVETSSRMDVDFKYLFGVKEISLELMQSYFRQDLSKFLENARWKFLAVRLEAEEHPGKSVVTNVAPKISEEIIRLTESIGNSGLIADRRSGYTDEILNYLRNYFPDVAPYDQSYKNTLDRVFDRMPSDRIRLIVSKLLAKEAVFNLGTGFILQLARESGTSDVDIVEAYLNISKKLDISASVANTVNAEDLLPSQKISKLKDLRELARHAVKETIMSNASSPVENGKTIRKAVLDLQSAGVSESDIRTLIKGLVKKGNGDSILPNLNHAIITVLNENGFAITEYQSPIVQFFKNGKVAGSGKSNSIVRQNEESLRTLRKAEVFLGQVAGKMKEQAASSPIWPFSKGDKGKKKEPRQQPVEQSTRPQAGAADLQYEKLHNKELSDARLTLINPDLSTEERIKAAGVLRNDDALETFNALVAASKDPNIGIRMTVAGALGYRKEPSQVDEGLRVLKGMKESLKDKNSTTDEEITSLKLFERLIDVAMGRLTEKKGSSPITPGGIDFRQMTITAQPMGNFSGLNFNLPKVNNIAGYNLDKELTQIKNMVSNGIIPSAIRVKEYVAACYAKGELNQRADQVVSCLVDICKLEEEQAIESKEELKEVLVILDAV